MSAQFRDFSSLGKGKVWVEEVNGKNRNWWQVFRKSLLSINVNLFPIPGLYDKGESVCAKLQNDLAKLQNGLVKLKNLYHIKEQIQYYTIAPPFSGGAKQHLLHKENGIETAFSQSLLADLPDTEHKGRFSRKNY